MLKNKWILCPQKQPDAKLRLFCFPFTGGGESIFYNWPKYFPDDIEVITIRLPGRESRINEKPYRKMVKLVGDLADGILPLFDKPFLFFGHSMGAHISFYLARHLRKKNMPHPSYIFASGARAPHLQATDSETLNYKMDDNEFIGKLNEQGSIPKEIYRNRKILEFVLPVLRADMEILNTTKYTEEAPLDCSISSFGGVYDNKVSRDDSEAWKKHTCGDFRLSMFPGKNLFLNTQQRHVIDAIIRDISLNWDNYNNRFLLTQNIQLMTVSNL